MIAPRELAARAEQTPHWPEGGGERFAGFGVMALPFRSGHVLALRRFPSSSIGPGYTSVWHRTPGGEWTFYQDVDDRHSCARYFGPALLRTVRCSVRLEWTSPTRLAVRAGDEVDWHLTLGSGPATRILSAIANHLPAALWRSSAMVRAMSLAARAVLQAGRVELTGVVPGGQRFVAQPRAVFRIEDSEARIRGADLGRPGPLATQARLRDFWLPQRGLFMIGGAAFVGRGRLETT